MRLTFAHAGLAALALSLPAAAQASDVKEVHKTVALEKDGRLSIHTYKGSITVTTWDRPEARIDVRIEPDEDWRDSREAVQWTEVRISGSGGSVNIKSDYDEVKRHHRRFLGLFEFDDFSLPLIHYTIQMPATAHLDIEDYKSDSRVTDLKSDLKLHTYKGSARVVNLDGAARVDTYKGDIHVDFARFTRASRLETHKGEIDVRLPRDSRFDLDTEAGRRGEIDSDFTMVTRASRHRSAWTSGSINGGGPELRLTTYKGTLRVRAK